MRATIALLVVVLGLGLWGCGDSESAGAEAARRQVEAEQKAKAAQSAPPKRMATPVPGQARVPCTQLIDPAAFQTALGEKEPLVIKDVTAGQREAASSCSLIRGGKRPGEAEQKALLKKAGRLGVLPGDELCSISAFCSTIEDPERFKAACKQRKDRDDESLGSYACVHIVAVGADDVKVFQLLDDDTRCILEIRGGPSNVNNDLIASCAKAARDTIGPAQIKVSAIPTSAEAPPPSAPGSAN